MTEPRKTLLIIGDGRRESLGRDQAAYLARSLAPAYDVIAGTHEGNPGLALTAWSQARPHSARLCQTVESRTQDNDEGAFGNPILFQGETKADLREHLVLSADAVLALGGRSGTLRELFLALYAGKPVVLLSGAGPVSAYAAKATALCGSSNLHFAKSLPEAVERLYANITEQQ